MNLAKHIKMILVLLTTFFMGVSFADVRPVKVPNSSSGQTANNSTSQPSQPQQARQSQNSKKQKQAHQANSAQKNHSAKHTEKRLERLEKRKERITKRIAKLEAKLPTLSAERKAKVQKRIAKLKERLAKLVERIAALKSGSQFLVQSYMQSNNRELASVNSNANLQTLPSSSPTYVSTGYETASVDLENESSANEAPVAAVPMTSAGAE